MKIDRKRKKTIVFDLDETLVKVCEDPSKFESRGVYDKELILDFYDPKSCIDVNKKVYVSFRPYLMEMLTKLNQNFELVLFTAGLKGYASAIVNLIER